MLIDIKKNSKVYILCPYIKTGGPRSLHTLGKKLIENGVNVYVVYLTEVKQNIPLYEDLVLPVANEVEDLEENVVVVPEKEIKLLDKYCKVKKMVWWLSLYFFKLNDPFWFVKTMVQRRGLPSILYFPELVYYICRNIDMINVWKEHYAIEKRLFNYHHLYNCNIIKDYLKKKSVKESDMKKLVGPIAPTFFDIDKDSLILNKEDIVAVNPKKTDKVVLKMLKDKLSKFRNDIRVVEIKNMSQNQVKETLMKSKLYVDLGYFPGTERIPREAALVYCNIITSRIGAASDDLDIPIEKKYKVDIQRHNIKNIANKIVTMIDNYENDISDFDNYRKLALNQLERFDGDIADIFQIID